MLAAAAAAVVVGGVGVSSSSMFGTPAYASWQSQPEAMSASVAHAVATECGVRAPLSVDRRGHHAYVLGQTQANWVSCIATLPGKSAEGLDSTYVSTTPKEAGNTQVPTASNVIALVDVKVPEGNHVKGEPAPLSYVSGRVAPSVKRVTVTSASGLVTATVRDSYFSAWWPGNDTTDAIVRAYGANGHQLGSASPGSWDQVLR